MEIDYVTLALPFHASGEATRYIYWTAWLGKELCYSILPNRRYVDGVILGELRDLA